MVGTNLIEAPAKDLVTKCDLADMEQRLIKSFSSLLHPVTKQLKTLTDKLEESNKKAEGFLERVAALHECAGMVQKDVTALSGKMLLMDILNRHLNIKIHGVPEKGEEKENLSPLSCFGLQKK